MKETISNLGKVYVTETSIQNNIDRVICNGMYGLCREKVHPHEIIIEGNPNYGFIGASNKPIDDIVLVPYGKLRKDIIKIIRMRKNIDKYIIEYFGIKKEELK